MKAQLLTSKQEAFCRAMLVADSASAAYRQAYSAARMKDKQVWEEASKLLAKPMVAQRVRELRAGAAEKAMATSADVLTEAMRIARFDVRKLFMADGSPKSLDELDNDTAACVQGIEVLEIWEGSGENRVFVGYVRRYKIADKNAALEKLFKHFGLFERDRQQQADPIRELIASVSGQAFRPVPQPVIDRIGRDAN